MESTSTLIDTSLCRRAHAKVTHLYIFGVGADRSISIATSPFSARCDVQFSLRRCMQSREALTSVSSTTSTRGRAPGATPGYCLIAGGGLVGSVAVDDRATGGAA